MVVEVDRRQVLAYRIAAQELHRPAGRRLAELAVLGLGVQDSQVGTARLAVAARLDCDPAALAGQGFVDALQQAELTLAWSHRGAPHVHRRADLAWAAATLVPLSDADALARLSWQRGDLAQAGMPPTRALTTAAEALREVVDHTMTKGAASERVTQVLPPGLTRWCRGCQATHIHEQLMRLATLRAGIRLEPEVSPATLTPVPDFGAVVTGPDPAACARAVTEYLRVHGPAGPAEAAGFLSTTKAVAAQVWPDGLAEVDVEGARLFLPEERVADLENPPEPAFVRLLPPLDPLVQARDRRTLVPDKGLHKAVWKVLGNPGVVLADGEIAGTWRAKARGRKTLEITVSTFAPLPPPIRSEVAAEAERMAALRGFPSATLQFD